jgi:hypothetical protein
VIRQIPTNPELSALAVEDRSGGCTLFLVAKLNVSVRSGFTSWSLVAEDGRKHCFVSKGEVKWEVK